MKKKILSVLCAICLVLPCFFGLAGCAKKLENLDGYLANISNYSSLGVGILNSSNSARAESSVFASRNLDYALASSSSKKTVLVGVDKDNKVKPVEFAKGKKSKTPELNLLSFNQTERYIIVTFSKEITSYIFETQFWNDKTKNTYLIDKQTNNVYKLDLSNHFTVGMYGYGIAGSDCGDYIVFNVENSYYKVGVNSEGELEVKEFYKLNMLPENSEIFLCDKYGNALIYRYNNGQKSYYVLNNQGELKALNYDLERFGGILSSAPRTYRALDGKIYDNGLVLNENGDFVAAQSMPENYLLPTEAIIYSDQEADYYYMPQIYDGARNFFWIYEQTVIKVSKTDNSITPISLGFGVDLDIDKYVANGQFVYFVSGDNKVIRFSVITGESQTYNVNNVVALNSISLYNHNEIQFEGLDSYLNTVKGVIKQNGEIDYSFKAPGFVCYYISPLR